MVAYAVAVGIGGDRVRTEQLFERVGQVVLVAVRVGVGIAQQVRGAGGIRYGESLAFHRDTLVLKEYRAIVVSRFAFTVKLLRAGGDAGRLRCARLVNVALQ